jgi:hypothetical protein
MLSWYCERLLKRDTRLLGDGSGDEMDVGDMGQAVILLSVQEVWEAVCDET